MQSRTAIRPTRNPARAAEVARLEAVRDSFLLDADPDDEIERFVEMAGKRFHRGVSLLVLDDLGLHVRYGDQRLLGQSPRALDLCSRTIEEPDGVLVVEDVLDDPRSAATPRVPRPGGIRFYAGAAVRSGGHRIGALCIADPEPGTLSRPEIEELRAFADELGRLAQGNRRRGEERTELLRELSDAITGLSMPLRFQPIVGGRDLRPRAYEALLRWTRADGRTVAPDVLIPLAERFGMVGALDRAVLAAGCRSAASWACGSPISINVSATWFGRRGHCLVPVIEAALDASGLPAGRLMIEVTEQVMIEDVDRAVRDLRAIRDLGVRVALDDFGTGFSSLSLLASLPCDVLKLDRQFMTGVGEHRRAEDLLRGVLALARRLDLAVCVEGVETPRQLDFLSASGCDLMQGHLIDRLLEAGAEGAPVSPDRPDGDERPLPDAQPRSRFAGPV